jgi:type I restriction enzyme S subunit
MPFLTVKDISDDELDFSGCSFISDDDYKAAAVGNSAPRPGDVLFSKDGTVGKVHVVSTERPFAVLSSLAILRPKAGVVDARYLGYALRSPTVLGEALKKKTGSAIRRIVLSDLREVRFPLPLIPEQRRIAAILGKADDIRKKRQVALNLAHELLRSAYLDMFGDPVTNRKGLPEKSLAEITTVTTGNTPSREVSAYFGDQIEWIKSDNINTPFHFLTKATEGLSEAGLRVGRSAPAGSTLITCIAGSPSCIGNAALADRLVSFNQQINALIPKAGIEPEFIYATTLFSKARIQAASTNGMKGMVSKGALEQVRFIFPPSDQRVRFVAIFRKVMALTEKLESAASEAHMLYGSLAQRAFKGQLSGL